MANVNIKFANSIHFTSKCFKGKGSESWDLVGISIKKSRYLHLENKPLAPSSQREEATVLSADYQKSIQVGF